MPTDTTGNPRMGVLAVLPFLLVGLVMMCWVKEPKAAVRDEVPALS